MRKQVGFTLVELVVVIAVLGILAATALPRFINVQNNARAASMNALAASVRSGANLARAAWVAAGSTGGVVTMDNVQVQVGANGYPLPTAVGIQAALQSFDANVYVLTPGAGTAPATFNYINFAGCSFTYDPTTGVVNTNAISPANAPANC